MTDLEEGQPPEPVAPGSNLINHGSFFPNAVGVSIA